MRWQRKKRKKKKKQVEKKATSTYDELVADMEDVQEGGADPTRAGGNNGMDDDEDMAAIGAVTD